MLHASKHLFDLPTGELAVIRGLAGGPCPMRLYDARAEREAGPVLVFFHGGGYVVGDLDSHDGLCRDLAHRSGWAVLSVEYRLAPEHRFPTALHDAQDAAAWLAAEGAGYGLLVPP